MRTQTSQWLAAALTGLLVVLVAGCNTGNFEFTTGLPKPYFKVGGGYDIQFVAPHDGIAVLADDRSREVLQTRTLRQGEDFTFQATPVMLEEQLGLDPDRVKISLYFIPRTLPPEGTTIHERQGQSSDR